MTLMTEARISEITALRWEQVDFECRRHRFCGAATVTVLCEFLCRLN